MFTHIHLRARYAIELTVYDADKANYPFKSSITGRRMERADAPALEAVLRAANPDLDVDAQLLRAPGADDVWALYVALLRPLEKVRQHAAFHPEGDALFHSLQVFELARRERSYDQEFILAALLHDVGKAIDPADHVGAAVGALAGVVTDRTLWLIAHHMDAHAYRAGTLGARARRRLEESEDFEDLLLLAELDRAGRVPGAVVAGIEEAIGFLQGMEA